MQRVLVFCILGLAYSNLSQAQSALEQTTLLLNNPNERAKVISQDPKAREADNQVKSLGLSQEGQNQVYELSSKIMEKVTTDSGGDAEKMTEKVNGYLRNPASIEKDLTPEQKQKIHSLSESKTQ